MRLSLALAFLFAACSPRADAPSGDTVPPPSAVIPIPVPDPPLGAFPRIGLAMRDTLAIWCAAFPNDSTAPAIAPGRAVTIVFAKPTGLPALKARVVAVRNQPCWAAFGQPRQSDYQTYDLVLLDSDAQTDVSDVALAVASTAPWARDSDGRTRADLDADRSAEEARRCAADEGEHFTIWSPGSNGPPVRRAHEYYDWGAVVDRTCKPGEDGQDPVVPPTPR